MTKDEAITILSNATFSDDWQGNEELTTAYYMAMEALGNDWTPVSERLPAKDITVLVTTAWHDVDIAHRTYSPWGGPDYWENESVAFDDESIIAWKFMPEPYKESEEE